MEEFEYKSFKEYENKYPELLTAFLSSYEDNNEQDFLKIELKKMKEEYLYNTVFSWNKKTIFESFHDIPTPEENDEIKARSNAATSINRIVEFLENKINNFNPASHKVSDIKNTELNKRLLLDSEEASYIDDSINKNETVIKKHEDIFSNNGFILFEHILKEYVKKGRGRLSDIGFFYWAMFRDEKKYIHQRPEAFKEWYFRTYNKEDLGKIKTYDQLKNIDRIKGYSSALEWLKSQKQ